MIAGNGLRWILTAVFVAPVLYGTWRICAPGSALGDRVDHVLHVVAGLLMIAMVWPWGMELSAGPQLVVLVTGAVWFMGSAPFRAATGSRATASLAALPHVLMMLAMAWMVAVMGTSAAVSGHGGGIDTHAVFSTHVPGGSGATLMRLAGTGPRLMAGLLAVLLTAIGLRWLAASFGRVRPAPCGTSGSGRDGDGALAHACHAAMALGMAEMFVLLV
jgi:hypothetical protein